MPTERRAAAVAHANEIDFYERFVARTCLRLKSSSGTWREEIEMPLGGARERAEAVPLSLPVKMKLELSLKTRSCR